jgi:hypothetical protein
MKSFDRLKLGAQFVITSEKFRAAKHAGKDASDRDTKGNAAIRSYLDLAVAAGVDRQPWFIDFEIEEHFAPPATKPSAEKIRKVRRMLTVEIAAARKRAAQ